MSDHEKQGTAYDPGASGHELLGRAKKPETEAVTTPLDAYVTTKPGEPPFTLQGGDPLAAPLVRLWAFGARVRSGRTTGNMLQEILTDFHERAKATKAQTKAETQDLLLRASQAEEVSWDMDAYLKGQIGAEPETSGEKLSVPERLDLFDLRVFAASRMSNMFSEMLEIYERLQDAGFNDGLAYANMRSIYSMLRNTYNFLQPQRDRQLDVTTSPFTR